MLNLRYVLFVSVALLFAATAFMGCSSPSTSKPAGGNQVSDDWKAGLDEDVVTALTKLSDGERTAALAQRTCPVTDKPLGSMGKPPKVTVDGRDVFLCCEGCEEELKNDAAKYLAQLPPKQ